MLPTPHAVTFNKSSSVIETKLFFFNSVISLKDIRSTRASVAWMKGSAVNDLLEHSTKYPVGSHLHPSGHCIATLAGRITNLNQNATTGVAKSRDTNTTVSLDGMASCCNMHRERERERESGTGNECVCGEGMAEGRRETLWRVTGNCNGRCAHCRNVQRE